MDLRIDKAFFPFGNCCESELISCRFKKHNWSCWGSSNSYHASYIICSHLQVEAKLLGLVTVLGYLLNGFPLKVIFILAEGSVCVELIHDTSLLLWYLRDEHLGCLCKENQKTGYSCYSTVKLLTWTYKIYIHRSTLLRHILHKLLLCKISLSINDYVLHTYPLSFCSLLAIVSYLI